MVPDVILGGRFKKIQYRFPLNARVAAQDLGFESSLFWYHSSNYFGEDVYLPDRLMRINIISVKMFLGTLEF